MLVRLFSIVLIAIAICCPAAQQGEEQQHTVQLTREMVDTLLQVLSPNCRIEMEGALSSQLEISDECKYEIQRTLASFQSNQELADEDGNSQPTPSSTKEPSAAKPAPVGGVSPTIYIFGFVTAAAAVVAGLVVYVNSNRTTPPAAKPKKLSKKKVS